MDAERDLTAADRVVRLLRHLGVARAHFAGGAAVAAAHPELVASLALVAPSSNDAAPLRQLVADQALAAPPLVIHSDAGPLAGSAPNVLAAYPGATAVVLRDYPSALWSDTVADRAGVIAPALAGWHAGAINPAARLPPPASHRRRSP